jgi:hypothetical protein
MPRLKGIARTRRHRKDGSFVEYHFAWRGGPCIWKTGDRHEVGDREYEAAYYRAHGGEPEKAPAPARDIGHFREVIRAFLTATTTVATRTRTSAIWRSGSRGSRRSSATR